MTSLPKYPSDLPRSALPNRGGVLKDYPLNTLLSSVPVALLCTFLTLVFSVSLAALVFRGPLAPFLPEGVGMALITACVVGLVTTFTSSIPSAIAIPSDRTAPMLAIMVSAIAATVSRHGSPDLILPTCLAALSLSTFVTGVLLLLLGRFRLGRLVRFLPFPVIGGFTAGAGWLLLKGGVGVMLGSDLTISNISLLSSPSLALKWMPAAALACFLVMAMRRIQHFLVAPTLIFSATALFYSVVWWTHIPLATLREKGWLLGSIPEQLAWHPLTLGLVRAADWKALIENLYYLGPVLILASVSMLLISSAVEVQLGSDVDTDRELQSAGCANLASAFCGGFIGFHSLSLTTLAIRLGPRSRWIGLLTAVAIALLILCGPRVVTYLPTPLMGALLLYVGLNFLIEWLIEAYRRMPRSEYALVVFIVLIVAWFDYLTAVGVGLALAVALFALRYSQVDVVRLELSGAQRHSNIDRTPEEASVLQQERPSILILDLQGYLFFGTAHQVLTLVKQRAGLAPGIALRYLIIDFRHVTGFDGSALQIFARLTSFAQGMNFVIVYTGLSSTLRAKLERDPRLNSGQAGLLTRPDIDHAIEWCEEGILTPHRDKITSQDIPLDVMIGQALQGNSAVADRLMRYLEPVSVPVGTVLVKQGDTTQDLFLIQKGQVSARFQTRHGKTVRLRTMGPGSVVGEIGMYLKVPRSASLCVETESIIWRLRPEVVERMTHEDPETAAALHEFLARVVSSRLAQANELLETMLR